AADASVEVDDHAPGRLRLRPFGIEGFLVALLRELRGRMRRRDGANQACDFAVHQMVMLCRRQIHVRASRLDNADAVPWLRPTAEAIGVVADAGADPPRALPPISEI